mgnify:FL=1
MSFLTPLQSLQDLLDRAVEAEAYLVKVGPQVEKARGEARDAQESLAGAQSALRDERERLAELLKSGEIEAKAQVREVERSLGVELAKKTEDHRIRTEGMNRTFNRVLSTVDDLVSKRSELQAQADTLRSQIDTLKAELAKILQRAGGSGG